MSFINTKDGTKLYYEDLGTGKPVVFVHGWCISCDSWEYVINELPGRGVRCILYDQRGCGRSDKPWKGYDYSTLAGDLSELIEQLGLEEVTLVGHSLGCGVVVRYLSEYGQTRVTQTVLLATTTPYPLLSEGNPDGLEKAVFEGLVHEIRTDRAAYVRALAHPFVAGPKSRLPVSADLVEWGIQLTMQASPFAAAEFIQAMSSTDQREEMKRISIPVLLIHGRLDISSPMALSAEKSLALLPNAQLIVYEDGAHGFYMVEGARVASDILRFVNDWKGMRIAE